MIHIEPPRIKNVMERCVESMAWLLKWLADRWALTLEWCCRLDVRPMVVVVCVVQVVHQ